MQSPCSIGRGCGSLLARSLGRYEIAPFQKEAHEQTAIHTTWRSIIGTHSCWPAVIYDERIVNAASYLPSCLPKSVTTSRDRTRCATRAHYVFTVERVSGLSVSRQ